MFGFLNIYKPEKMTSFDVIRVLRKIIHIKQIGHTGTLDPFAVGVLPICIGKTTKLIEYLPDDKAYRATVQFGADTDTYDKDGQIIRNYENKINEEDLKKVLKTFQGEIEQVPPMYSALKVNGKKLYEYAREGKNLEIKSRKVTISKIELLNFDIEKQQAQIYVECSKGTYIRSIAYDLGQKLNCGGYLTALERTKAGAFTIKTSVRLEDIKTVEDVETNLVNPLDILPQKQYKLSAVEKEKVSHGNEIYLPENSTLANGEVVILIYDNKIIAIGYKDNNKIKVKKVLEAA